ncbi:MAG: PAS domain S-box protein, partial [Cytophagaceae bacterium]
MDFYYLIIRMTGHKKSADEEVLALQKELQRVKQQTASALEAVGIGLWVMYPAQHRIDWDEQCQKIYRWPEASVSLDDLFRQINPQDLVHLRALVTNPPSRKTQKPTTVDYRITSPEDGVMRWIRITGRVATQPSGAGDCFSGTAQDITDEKRKEATLQTIEQRFQSAFMNASVGVVILDTQSNIQLINKAFADLVGYTQEELLDQHFGAISHPDDVEENVALVQQLIRGESNSYIFNKRYLHKSGTIVWGQVSSALIRNQDGEPDSFISIVQDITAELQAQAEQKKLVSLLKASEERLRDAIELSKLSTYEINPDNGTILLSGRAKGWLGFKPDEMPLLEQVFATIRD